MGGDPAELMRICIENGTFTVSFLKEGLQKARFFFGVQSNSVVFIHVFVSSSGDGLTTCSSTRGMPVRVLTF